MEYPINIVNIVLSLFLLVFFISVSIKLLSTLRKTKLSHIKWLIFVFLATSSVGFLKMGEKLFPFLEIGFNILELIAIVSLILFTKHAFYQNRKSSFWYILILAVGLSIGATIASVGKIISGEIPIYLFELYLLSHAVIIASIWHASAAFSSLNSIKNKNIDKNILLRYKLIGISAIFLSIQAFLFPIHGLLNSFLKATYIPEIYNSINLCLSVSFAFSQFYAWIVLGKKIKQGKVDFHSEKQLSEEEIAKMINEGL